MDNETEKVPINATQIIMKYKNIKDRLNFCFEKNWHHPKEIGFDANFFLKVLMGEKKYLPNNFTVNYKLHYFRRGEKLDKNYIIEKMRGNPAYAIYTPDVKDAKKFSKEFLLLLIAYVDPALYRQLYSINKSQLQDRIYNKWGDYQIDIQKNLLKDIEEFTSTTAKNNLRGGFRRTKNSEPVGTFYKFKNINIEENLKEKNLQRIQNRNDYLQNQLNQFNQLNEINQNNQKKNQELEMENQKLVLKLKEMEKIDRYNKEEMFKISEVNNKEGGKRISNESKMSNENKNSRGAQMNEIKIKLVPNSSKQKK